MENKQTAKNLVKSLSNEKALCIANYIRNAESPALAAATLVYHLKKLARHGT